jgi:hypothetical protein
MIDAVEKLSDDQRAGNNRIQVPRSLNQCCVPDSYLESMLLIRPSKNVFRQHRPIAVMGTGNPVPSPSSAHSGITKDRSYMELYVDQTLRPKPPLTTALVNWLDV